MTEIELLGFIGAGLLIVAWIPQAAKTLHIHATTLHPAFALFYFVGSIVLLGYSLTIGDLPFSILNAVSAAFAVMSLYYASLIRLVKKEIN